MRVLVLGGSGMLGHKLVQQWRDRIDVWTTLRGDYQQFERYTLFDPAQTIERVEVENFDTVLKAFAIARPDTVVNCIGIVKQLETAKNPVPTLLVNSIFPHRLAELCRATGARLITLSTDCVFSGSRGNYSENDLPDALDLYGQSKHFGEVDAENCLTIRTSIIGRELKSAHGLIEWFLANRNATVKGFTNAVFSGFPTVVLADILLEIICQHTALNGVWHVASEPISKYDLLHLVRSALNLRTEIEPFNDFYCDRSLNDRRFRAVVDPPTLSWQDMISRMSAEADCYESWRKL